MKSLKQRKKREKKVIISNSWKRHLTYIYLKHYFFLIVFVFFSSMRITNNIEQKLVKFHFLNVYITFFFFCFNKRNENKITHYTFFYTNLILNVIFFFLLYIYKK
jgi:hypothetical protein